jgi:hypothetical protein
MARSQGKDVGRARIALTSLLIVLGVLVTWLRASAWLMPATEPCPRCDPAPAVDTGPSRDLIERSIAGDLGGGVARLDDHRGERAGFRRAAPSQRTPAAQNRWWCKQFVDRGARACAAPVLDGATAPDTGVERPLAAESQRDEPPPSRALEVHGPRGPPASQSQLSHAAV